MQAHRRDLIGVDERGLRCGETHHRAKIPDAVVNAVRSLHEDQGLTCREIAQLLDIPYHTVRDLVSYKRRALVVRGWRKPLEPRSDGKQEEQPQEGPDQAPA
jgi:hypothetical protein